MQAGLRPGTSSESSSGSSSGSSGGAGGGGGLHGVPGRGGRRERVERGMARSLLALELFQESTIFRVQMPATSARTADGQPTAAEVCLSSWAQPRNPVRPQSLAISELLRVPAHAWIQQSMRWWRVSIL